MKRRRPNARPSLRQRRAQYFQREAFRDHLEFAAMELAGGSVKGAELEARKALRIAPGDGDATLLLCGILRGSGRDREALGMLREALGRSPKDTFLLNEFARCAVHLDRLDEAESAIQKLQNRLEQNPASARGMQAEMRREARKVLKEIKRRRRPEPEAPLPAQRPLFGDDSRGVWTSAGGPGQATRERRPAPRPGAAVPAPIAARLDTGAGGIYRPTPGPGRPGDDPWAAVPPEPRDPPGSSEPVTSIPSRHIPSRSSRGGADHDVAASPGIPPAPIQAAGAAPAAPPTCAVRFEDGPSSSSLWSDLPWRDDIEDRELLLEAEQIRRVTQFEDLLCLPTLRGVVRLEYQVETVRKILRRLNGRALLCDEVGLGKTIEAGMVIKEYLLRGLARSILILAPPGLVRQWRDEMSEKFALDFVLWDERARAPRPPAAPLLAIGSLALARLPQNAETFTGTEWDMVVVDEAHHVRRRSTRSWALVNALRKRFVLLLSATPVHNHLMELYELVTLVQPGILGTQAEFRRRFGDGKGERRVANPEALREALLEVMVRNTRAHADVALPRRFATTLILDPNPAESDAYRAASEFARRAYAGAGVPARMGLRHLLGAAGSGSRAVAGVAQRMMEGRFAHSAGAQESPDSSPGAPDTPPAQEDAALPRNGDAGAGPAREAEDAPPEMDALARTGGEAGVPWTLDEEGMLLLRRVREAACAGASTKTDRLLQLLSDSEDQVLVFCRYRATLADLAERLTGAGISHVQYHGNLTRAEKDRAIEAFREGARVLLSTESGGEGRNMQFCRALINYDLPWDPMLIEQRIGRLHRIGQRRDVFVFNLVLAGTLEEEMLRILEEKIHLFELLVGEVDSILGHLDRREEFAEIILDMWAGARNDEETRRRFDQFGLDLEAARRSYDSEKSLDEAIFSDGLEV